MSKFRGLRGCIGPTMAALVGVAAASLMASTGCERGETCPDHSCGKECEDPELPPGGAKRSFCTSAGYGFASAEDMACTAAQDDDVVIVGRIASVTPYDHPEQGEGPDGDWALVHHRIAVKVDVEEVLLGDSTMQSYQLWSESSCPTLEHASSKTVCGAEPNDKGDCSFSATDHGRSFSAQLDGSCHRPAIKGTVGDRAVFYVHLVGTASGFDEVAENTAFHQAQIPLVNGSANLTDLGDPHKNVPEADLLDEIRNIWQGRLAGTFACT